MHPALAPTLLRLRREAAAIPGLDCAPLTEWQLTDCSDCRWGITTAAFCCRGAKACCHFCPRCYGRGARPLCKKRVEMCRTELLDIVLKMPLLDVAPPPPPPVLRSHTEGVIYAHVSESGAQLLEMADAHGMPALVRGGRTLPDLGELFALPDRGVEARFFSGVKGTAQVGTGRVQLAAFRERLAANDMSGAGVQVFDFPHVLNFPVKEASLESLMPLAYATFLSNLAHGVDISVSLEAVRPHMVQCYPSVGYSVTGLHVDVGGVAENTSLWSSAAEGEVLAVWLFFAREQTGQLLSILQAHQRLADGELVLTEADLETLAESGVRPTTVAQRLGDTVVVPIGCLHQVINLQCSFKVARDILPAFSLERQLALHEFMHELRPDAEWLLLHPLQAAIVAAAHLAPPSV